MTTTSVRSDTELASSLRVSLTRLGRRLRTEEVADVPVSVGGLAVLAHLARAGECGLRQLADAERVRPPSMTRTVACLEEAGLVTRRAHPTDGRQALVGITPAGTDLLAAERRRRDAWLAQRLKDLTTEERALLRRAAPILERLSNTR